VSTSMRDGSARIQFRLHPKHLSFAAPFFQAIRLAARRDDGVLVVKPVTDICLREAVQAEFASGKRDNCSNVSVGITSRLAT